jgi:hypothetical protein
MRLKGRNLRVELGAAFGTSLVSLLLIRGSPRFTVRSRFCLWLPLVAVPNLMFGWAINAISEPPLFPSTRTESFLATRPGVFRTSRLVSLDILPTNTAERSGLFEIAGATPAALSRYTRVVEAVEPGAMRLQKSFPGFQNPSLAGSRLLDLLNVEFLLSHVKLPLPEMLREGSVRVYRRPSVLPRFFVVYRAELYEDVQQGLNRLTSEDFDPGRTALVRGRTPPAIESVFRGRIRDGLTNFPSVRSASVPIWLSAVVLSSVSARFGNASERARRLPLRSMAPSRAA